MWTSGTRPRNITESKSSAVLSQSPAPYWIRWSRRSTMSWVVIETWWEMFPMVEKKMILFIFYILLSLVELCISFVIETNEGDSLPHPWKVIHFHIHGRWFTSTALVHKKGRVKKRGRFHFLGVFVPNESDSLSRPCQNTFGQYDPIGPWLWKSITYLAYTTQRCFCNRSSAKFWNTLWYLLIFIIHCNYGKFLTFYMQMLSSCNFVLIFSFLQFFTKGITNLNHFWEKTNKCNDKCHNPSPYFQYI